MLFCGHRSSVIIGRWIIPNIKAFETTTSRQSSYLFRCKRLNSTQVNDSARKKYFAELMGSTVYVAAKRLKIHKELNFKPITEIEQVLALLYDLGFKREEVMENVQILTVNPVLIRRRFQCLKEVGIDHLGLPAIIRYHEILACSINLLSGKGLLSNFTNPVDFLLQNHYFPDKLRDQILASYANNENLSLASMRTLVFIEVLLYFFNCDPVIAHSMVKVIPCYSLTELVKMADTLRNEMNLPFSTIRTMPSILTIDPEAIARLKEICANCNADFEAIVSKNPTILIKDPDDFQLICRYLCDFGVPMTVIGESPYLFRLSPENVLNSLVTLSKKPEFPLLKMQSKIVTMILKYKPKICSDYKIYPKVVGNLATLAKNAPELEKFLGRESTIQIKQLLPYLADRLNCSIEDVKMNLCRHPWYDETPIMKIRNSLSYLLSHGFTPRQIVGGLALLLYSETQIAIAWGRLPNLEIAQPFHEWKDSDNVLQLLLYAMEKEEQNCLDPINPAYASIGKLLHRKRSLCRKRSLPRKSS